MNCTRYLMPGRLCRFGRSLLVVAAVCLLWTSGMEAFAASRYGTPLQFDPPPVDLGDHAESTDGSSESHAAPAQREERAPAPPPVRQAESIASAGAGESTAAVKPPAGDEAPKPAAKPVRLFGTVEFRSPIKDLPKWERVRGLERKTPSFVDGVFDVQNQRVAERWSKLREKIVDAPLMEQARQVNIFFNQWPYKTDREVWGVEDYWATPREFVRKSGDCEDYAISKYYALRDLGVPASQLRIAAVKDTIRNLGHAVVVVFVDGDAYLLDNLSNLVLSHAKLKHYAPQYTVNEQYLWRHVKPKSTPGGKK